MWQGWSVCMGEGGGLYLDAKCKAVSLYMAWKHIGGTEVHLHSFLTSAPDEEMSPSRPGSFTPGSDWTGDWVGLDVSDKTADHLLLQAVLPVEAYCRF